MVDTSALRAGGCIIRGGSSPLLDTLVDFSLKSVILASIFGSSLNFSTDNNFG